ncbi:MAG: NUDIX domain-containing protein [Candidatus Paceibacterota bacterium]|jgi:ADP-ribose pyrophosphatase YjhB (NUDIX family)
MKILKTIKDIDFGFEDSTPQVYIERETARGIIFDDSNNVALLYSIKKDYYTLPGGGIEEGESVIQALHREMIEEIGCKITDIKEVGSVEEYRNNEALHQISHCFIARLAGDKGEPQPTEEEILEDFNPVWMPIDEAIKKIGSKENEGFRRGKYMVARNLVFLNEAKKYL